MLIYSYIIFGIPILGGFYYILFFQFILFLLLHVVSVYMCLSFLREKFVEKNPIMFAAWLHSFISF